MWVMEETDGPQGPTSDMSPTSKGACSANLLFGEENHGTEYDWYVTIDSVRAIERGMPFSSPVLCSEEHTLVSECLCSPDCTLHTAITHMIQY